MTLVYSTACGAPMMPRHRALARSFNAHMLRRCARLRTPSHMLVTRDSHRRLLFSCSSAINPGRAAVFSAATAAAGAHAYLFSGRQIASCEAAQTSMSKPTMEDMVQTLAPQPLAPRPRLTISLVLACFWRAAYLMFTFGPLLLCYPLSKFEVRGGRVRPCAKSHVSSVGSRFRPAACAVL